MSHGITEHTLTGIRAPHLQNGGDSQFMTMQNDGFQYDSSMPSRAYGSTSLGLGLWPYTLDYESIQVMKEWKEHRMRELQFDLF